MCETENMLILSAKGQVKTPHFQCGGHEFDPWSGTKIPHVASLKKIKIYIYILIHINMHSKNYLPQQNLHWKNLNRQGRLYSRLLNTIEERGKKI